MKHTLGILDFWEIVREDVARKTCDKSFYEHNGSGIPQNIRWFFAAEESAPGARKNIVVIYDGNDYSGNVQRNRESWPVSGYLGCNIDWSFRSFPDDGKNHVYQFHRVGENRYELNFIHSNGFGVEKTISFLEQYCGKNYIAPEKQNQMWLQ